MKSETSSPVSGPASSSHGFSDEQLAAFAHDGYLVDRGLISADMRSAMMAIIQRDLQQHAGPVELEADVDYPGAPESRDAEGGLTIRRLKNAIARGPVFTDLVAHPDVLTRLSQLLGADVVLPMAHHNCIMTKHPSHSSDTGWHQDVRYWAFERQELISMWVALGDEYSENGGLSVIPGSHREEYSTEQLDEELFLRPDLPENRPWLDAAVALQMQAGDVLFFHARTFHSASRNYTEQTKYSVVFTFRPADNPPIAGTRSAALPELKLPSV